MLHLFHLTNVCWFPSFVLIVLIADLLFILECFSEAWSVPSKYLIQFRVFKPLLLLILIHLIDSKKRLRIWNNHQKFIFYIYHRVTSFPRCRHPYFVNLGWFSFLRFLLFVYFVRMLSIRLIIIVLLWFNWCWLL